MEKKALLVNADGSGPAPVYHSHNSGQHRWHWSVHLYTILALGFTHESVNKKAGEVLGRNRRIHRRFPGTCHIDGLLFCNIRTLWARGSHF